MNASLTVYLSLAAMVAATLARGRKRAVIIQKQVPCSTSSGCSSKHNHPPPLGCYPLSDCRRRPRRWRKLGSRSKSKRKSCFVKRKSRPQVRGEYVQKGICSGVCVCVCGGIHLEGDAAHKENTDYYHGYTAVSSSFGIFLTPCLHPRGCISAIQRHKEDKIRRKREKRERRQASDWWRAIQLLTTNQPSYQSPNQSIHQPIKQSTTQAIE